MDSNELTDTRMPTINENGYERQNATMTLESSTSSYLQTHDEHKAHLMEAERSVTVRDNGISDPVAKSSSLSVLSCILCMECIGDWNALQLHLVKNHEVKTEALQAFMSLVDINDKDVFQNLEQIKGREHHEKCSDSVTRVNEHPELTSSSSIEAESNNLVINLGNNDESTEELKETENAKAVSFGDERERPADGRDGRGLGCSICSATFPDCDLLFKHQDETGHLNVRPTSSGPCYVCWAAQCGQTFTTSTLLRCHFVGTHVKSRSDRPATSEPTHVDQLLCGQCNQVFKKKDEFRMHCYCHKMERATECRSCGTRFSSILEFRKHKQVVHNEEMTSEQQELYEASLAAASSLALLGASGLEYMTTHVSKAPHWTTIFKEKDGQGSETNGQVSEITLENSAGEDKTDSRLDENSNSCLQSKFVGVRGSDGLTEDVFQQINSVRAKCSHSGSLSHNKCLSCKVGLNAKANGLLEIEPTEKHKRKRTRPAKVISDLETNNDVSTAGYCESGRKETSILDLTAASTGSRNPLMVPVALTSQLSSSLNPALTGLTGGASVVLPSGRSSVASQPIDRPFRCPLCKVSYTQKTQLDGHLASQQHLSRCTKMSDPSIRQHASTKLQTMSPYAGNHADQINQFAEFIRQQNVPISSFLPFGVVPLLNPLMTPLLPNRLVSSAAGTSVEADVLMSSLTTRRAGSAVGKESDEQTVETKSGSISNTDPTTSKSLPCDAVAETNDFSCARCCEVFSSVEQLNRHHGEAGCAEAARTILAPDLHNSKGSQTMMENILQRIGYECVKQFNEYRQKPKHRRNSNTELSKSSCKEHATRIAEDLENKQNNEDCSRVSQENVDEYFCWTCSKSFSSIFVLKAHQEQVHRQMVSIGAIEKIHNELKENYEKIRNKKEGSERPDANGEKRPQETTSAVNFEEEIKLKQQQQMQLSAAIQSMQMNILMSMGMLPQVFPRLPGYAHVPQEMFASQPFPMIDPMMMMQLQQQQQCNSTQSMIMSMGSPSQMSSAAGASSQKSARTRISEQQLLVLRANFDINNSPTEEQIQEMSERTGLAMKVIKHWFRNTLFKERQRNKDSPYNFNVPPATTLILDECEWAPKLSMVKEMSPSSDENSAAASNSNCDPPLEPKSESTATQVAARSELANDSTSGPNVAKASSSKLPLRADDTIAAVQSCSSQGTTEFNFMDPQHGINFNADMRNSMYVLSPSINMQERRAGRTRFSNHQNQVLQEFFDQNPYPKDDEVEALSRALNLRVRVIVVWFQNARQRVRKTEGHSSLADGSRPAQFQCGGCAVSFDQQVDLWQHQLTEHGMSKDSSYGESSYNEVCADDEEQGSRSSLGNEPDYENGSHRSVGGAKLECDKCFMTFELADQLNEHQRETHSHDPSVLSQPTGTERQQLDVSQKLFPELGRKMSEDGAVFRQSSDDEEHRADRRMRTTLAQDQLDYLYQKFSAESNPSRSALEAIALHLNLKPRVVQVWFQNTRARERRGQHRANSQKSLVRCSYCSSMFRGRTALDAHVAEQHPQSINNIAYPVDMVRNMQGMSSGLESVIPPFLAPNPMMNSAGITTLQSNMHYLYEKSFQQYMSKLTNMHATAQLPSSSSSSSNQSIQSAPTTKPPKPSSSKADEGPLDLTISGVTARNDQLKTEAVDISQASLFSPSLDDSFSETYSENDESGSGGVDNLSPSALGSNPSRNGAMFGAGKRYRTQMSSLQIRVMRAIFSSFKTPSLSECEILGQQIRLGKRVVQVWFQNSRAKEKKAGFPCLEKPDGISTNGNGLFQQLGNPATECRLCNVTYNINHTLQDHLFTKMHIDRVVVAVNSSEFGKSFPSIAFGESDSFEQHRISSANFLPLIKSMTNSSTAISTKTQESPENIHNNSYNHSVKTTSIERNSKRPQETSAKVSRDQPNDPGKSILNNTSILSSSMPFVNPLDASLRQFMGVPPAPTDLMGAMMPYLYPGGAIPPMLPGFNPIQLLSRTPNILPSLANALFNSAAMCGIQLAQLQIPKRAIEQIQDRLRDETCVMADYSEDCLAGVEVKAHLASEEITWLVEKTIHVGFICKKCHMVFPQVDACNAHQMMLCFKDAERFGDSVLKLEQRLYQCSRCKVNCSTVKEFKVHCAQEKHRKSTNPDAGSFVTSRHNSTTVSFGSSQQRVENTASEKDWSSPVVRIKLEKEEG